APRSSRCRTSSTRGSSRPKRRSRCPRPSSTSAITCRRTFPQGRSTAASRAGSSSSSPWPSTAAPGRSRSSTRRTTATSARKPSSPSRNGVSSRASTRVSPSRNAPERASASCPDTLFHITRRHRRAWFSCSNHALRWFASAPQRHEAVTVKIRRVLSLTPLVLLASAAQAQFRCDCTRIVAACNADVTVSGSSIEVTTDQNQCARVDYFVDGLPFVSVVVDGVERREWIPRAEPPRVLVQSCQVCRENAAGAEPASASSAAPQAQEASQDGVLEPLISGVPSYPESARGARGYVELAVVVNS